MILDIFWKPKWKKEAKLTLKGSNKFVNYKKDLIEEEHVKNIRARQKDLKDAIKTRDQKEVKRKTSLLEQECKKSLSTYVRPSSLFENTEVFFVAIVVALGLRTYYLQPFRIPTGSMQPTLNGLNGHYKSQDEWSSFPQRVTEMATHGRTYVNIVAENDCKISGVDQYQFLYFLTRATLTLSDGTKMSVSSTAGALGDLIKQTLKNTISPDDPRIGKQHFEYKKGEVIARGFIDSGDLVLVDKVSYHFRKPQRGETFVFDTRNIEEIHKPHEQNAGAQHAGQGAGDHYIKRCVGVPGDEISLDEHGNIIVNGKIAQDEGLQYAMQLTYDREELDNQRKYYTAISNNKKDYPKRGYWQVIKDARYSNTLTDSSKSIKLKGAENKQHAEYAAFGDNTKNSLDSRYWGAVKQYNLVGPALISLWPFTHEVDPHWGLIK